MQEGATPRAPAGGSGSDYAPALACTIAAATKIVGLSRTVIYELIKRNEIEARKAGRRTLILTASLSDYLSRLPRA